MIRSGHQLEMGELLQIAGGDKYRSRAFRRTAQLIEGMRELVTRMLSESVRSRSVTSFQPKHQVTTSGSRRAMSRCSQARPWWVL